jgi:hypothetical protein
MEELTHDFRVFREEVAQLSREEQLEVWECLSQRTESIAEQTLYAFFALPEDERLEMLDRLIDRRLLREAQIWGQAALGEQRSWTREVSSALDYDRPFSEMTVEERLALRRDMWEDSTPQAIAMRSEFQRLMDQRRQERGLPPPMYRRYG